jgi:hypothetical protein
MPLGKLSRKQINSGYKILTEAQDLIKSGEGTVTKFLDASNRFFTLIPHDFGMRSPPMLDNPDYIKSKERFTHLSCITFMRFLFELCPRT